jgi:hypothetical protein
MLTIEKALNKYARMMNSFSIAYLEPLLADDLHYASQWVFEEITSKQVYLDYIGSKLLAIKILITRSSQKWGFLRLSFRGHV